MRCPKCETLFLAKLPLPGELGEDTYSGFDGPTVMPTLPPGAAPTGFGTQPGTGAGGATTTSSTPAFPTTGALGHTSSLSSPPSPAFGSVWPSPSAQRATPSTAAVHLPSARVEPEPSSPSPSWSPRGAEEDPFASVGGAVAHRHAEISSSGFISPPSSSPSWSGATTTRAGSGASARPSPSMTLPRSRPRPPSVVAQAASWVFLFGSVVVAAAGSLVAAWTSGAIDLDATLMPMAERHLGVRPPYSFTGQDAVAPSELRRQATEKEHSGDLPAAAVLWLRAVSADPTDPAALAGQARVKAALGEAPP
jgi:hypothetical protein